MTEQTLSAFETDLLYEIGAFEGDGERPHGLGLAEALREEYGEINNGQLYPSLNRLEDLGLVDVDDVDGRTNAYSLSDAGRAHVQEDAEDRHRVAARL